MFCLNTPKAQAAPLKSPYSGLGVEGGPVTAHPRTLQWGWDAEGMGEGRILSLHYPVAHLVTGAPKRN